MPARHVLRPETRFVLATAAGTDALLPGQEPPTTLNWAGVVKVAVHERAVCAVQAVVRQEPAVGAPAAVVQALDRLAVATRVRMTWLAHRLDETVRALSGAGVPVVLLKGAGVGSTAYRSLAERQMGDLDLLVPPDKASRAREVALATGWFQTDHERREAFYQDHYHLPPLRDGKAPDLWLELHTGLLPEGHPFTFEAADVWRDARPLAGRPGLVPSPVHQVMHAVLHFGWAHAMSQGAWQAFSDIHHVSRQDGFEWEALVEEATRMGAAGVTYWTLTLAAATGRTTVPAEVLARLRPRRNPAVLRALGRHLAILMDPLATPCPSRKLSRRLWRSALRDDIAGRRITTPWEREALFDLPGERVNPTLPQWLARHLTGVGAYVRYARSLAGRTN